jgi:2-polyprenyl-6-methoxyphenol hydroxylase-like FAD-dependent oxidoreductase
MSETYDVVIVGGGIAGGALAAVLARSGIAVAVLERDPVPLDRVRGEFMARWGVTELKRLGLLETLAEAGGVFTERSIPTTRTHRAIRRFLSPSTSRPFCPTCPARSA